MKVVNQVFQTNDYSKFSFIEGNRNVNPLHVRRLENSFKIKYLMCPITVNEKHQIIDGQHRFTAAKNLKLPINFIIEEGLGIKDVQTLNTNTSNWKSVDYLQSFCDLGLPEYLKFQAFMNQFPDFGFASSLAILTNKPIGGNKIKGGKGKYKNMVDKSFQEGHLEIPDYNQSIETAKKIMEIKPFFKDFHERSFVRAIINLMKNKNYTQKRFIDRASKNAALFQKRVNVSDYELLIEDIYNANMASKNQVSLRY